VKYPGRNVKLSPAEQQAANALAEARAKASGTLASRGYAGEEGLRDLINKQLQGALEGNMELANPSSVRQMNEEKAMLSNRLRQELGQGWDRSTAGQNAMKNFETKWQMILDNERTQAKNFLQSAGMQRSGFTNQLEMQPGQMAGQELGMLAGIGSQDAALRYGVGATNAQQAGADRRALMQTGGQFTGMAAAPWLYQSLLDSIKQTG
jgi:hypothetical protein